MRYFTYIVARDYGFAPNPFWRFCTLATCKPMIRKVANINDWIFGTGSENNKSVGKLVYAMQVTEKLTFDQYWIDDRFQSKKAIMNGSLKQMYGDNIYHKSNSGVWLQENSHHTHSDGSINSINLDKDIKGVHVLVSNNFFYFGKMCLNIPDEIKDDICMKRQGFKYVKDDSANSLIGYLSKNYAPKRYSTPIQFNGRFERFKGK